MPDAAPKMAPAAVPIFRRPLSTAPDDPAESPLGRGRRCGLAGCAGDEPLRVGPRRSMVQSPESEVEPCHKPLGGRRVHSMVKGLKAPAGPFSDPALRLGGQFGTWPKRRRRVRSVAPRAPRESASRESGPCTAPFEGPGNATSRQSLNCGPLPRRPMRPVLPRTLCKAHLDAPGASAGGPGRSGARGPRAGFRAATRPRRRSPLEGRFGQSHCRGLSICH
mmetsp:Transcript_17088/g.57738  ORF Transcript_17088/g.57738 Transcript_17088/m.57738 type:complete len:221 (-) Transcript_17088:404-1066(-)